MGIKILKKDKKKKNYREELRKESIKLGGIWYNRWKNRSMMNCLE